MLRIHTIPVTELGQNARIVSDSETLDAVVIDPGGDAEKLVKYIRTQGLICRQIWLTHSHFDHCGGVSDFLAAIPCELVGHPGEQFMRARVEQIVAMYGLSGGTMKNCPEPDISITGGETLQVGAFSFETLFTPGHAPGHLCFYCASENTLIAGDTLFQGSIGRTDLPGGDYDTLMESISDKILTLPPETVVMPGHGPDTKVGIEARTNPFLQ